MVPVVAWSIMIAAALTNNAPLREWTFHVVDKQNNQGQFTCAFNIAPKLRDG